MRQYKINPHTSLTADLIDHKHTENEVKGQLLSPIVSVSVHSKKESDKSLGSPVKCMIWWNDETYSTMNWNC